MPRYRTTIINKVSHCCKPLPMQKVYVSWSRKCDLYLLFIADPNEGGSRSPSNRSLISNPQQEIPLQVMSSTASAGVKVQIIPPSKPTLTVSHSSAEAVPLIKNSSTTDINKNRSKSLRRHFRRNSSLKRRPTIEQLGAAADQSFNTTTSSCSVEIEPLEKDVTSPNGTRVKVTFVWMWLWCW